ncbi:hypothetical protein Tco_0942939 [Tanacetum coccineum]
MNCMQQLMQDPEDISDPTTALDMALELIQIAQPGMNIDQDRQMLMADNNVGNQFRENANRLSVAPGIANQHGNGNVVAAWAEGNSNEINGNQIRCYNYRGEGAYDEIEKVTANCNLQDNLQQASTSGTQSDKAPVYDSDGSAV